MVVESATVPVMSVPMMLLWTTLPVELFRLTLAPLTVPRPLPAITLPPPGSPTMVSGE